MTGSRIFVAGHRGLVGSAIVRCLRQRGLADNLILKTRDELDLREQAAVRSFFAAERPDYVFLAAAKVGGIYANATFPAEFLYDNLTIQANVVDGAWRNGVKKLVFLGSSCIYPRMAPQPIPEDSLLTGPLEQTNEAYAIAKIAGLKLARAYRDQYGLNTVTLMPTNLYGPGDNFDPKMAHVVPALIAKFLDACERDAPEVVIWGTGTPRREFLHVDDLADAALFIMDRYEGIDAINVGVGEDIRIADLATMIGRITGFDGRIVFDPSMPDGTPRKLLDVSRISALGWRPKIGLEEGLRDLVRWYTESHSLGIVRA